MEKPDAEFPQSAGKRSGTVCKACRKAERSEREAALGPEAVRAARKATREAMLARDPEYYSRKRREFTERNPGYDHRRYLADRARAKPQADSYAQCPGPACQCADCNAAKEDVA